MFYRYFATNNNKYITFVKKIKNNGKPCYKCQQVMESMEKNGVIKNIDRIEKVIDGKNTIGRLLAEKYKIKKAPFFIVTDNSGKQVIYTNYSMFLNNELNKK